MKKLLIPFVIFVAAVMTLSSCSNLSKISITKRHYRSGYYVDFGGNRNIPPAPVSARTERTGKQPASALAKPGNYINTTIPAPSTHKLPLVQKVKEPLKTLEIVSKKVVPQEPFQKIGTYPNSILNNDRQTMSQAAQYDGEHGERAALSLLWIVIVVILILWLIGILAGDFGIGPLINILLLIALVLLILWLLRIA